MKRVKGIVIAILTILMVLQLSIVGFAATEIPSATSDFYVNDFAEVFTSEEKQQLMDKAVLLANNYNGIQVVITTIKSLNGNTIEDYAYDMYNKYGIGKDDMGLLILLSTGDREIRVEVGRSMEAYVNDSKAGRFIDKYAIPYLKQNKFNEGLINLQENLINEIVSKVKAENETTTKTGNSIIASDVENETENLISNHNASTKEKGSVSKVITTLFWIAVILLVAAIIVFLIMVFIENNKKTKKTIDELNKNLEEANNSLEKEKQAKEEIIRNAREAANRKEEEFLNTLTNKERLLTNQFRDRIETLEGSCSSLKSSLREESNKCKEVQNELSTLQDRYNRIITIYPDADEKVDKMIAEEIKQKDMAAAKVVDEHILSALNILVDKDNVASFKKVLSEYSELTEIQKSYLKNDITDIQKFYEESVKLREEYERKLEEEKNERKAKEVSKIIIGVLSGITVGTASNLPDLRRAVNEYGRLNNASLKYFDNSLIQKLKKALKEAETDFAKQEKIKALKQAASNAEEKIKRKISYCYGCESELSQLQEAKRIYERLSHDEKEYFDKSVLRKLNDLIEKAERDKRENDEEEERRRRNSYYNSGGGSNLGGFGGSSGFRGGGGSSGFGGFGGRTGGGGASRKF